jgi:hypothetical protein
LHHILTRHEVLDDVIVGGDLSGNTVDHDSGGGDGFGLGGLGGLGGVLVHYGEHIRPSH